MIKRAYRNLYGIFILLLPGSCASPLRSAIEAHQGGNYGAAAACIRPSAEAGDLRAQYLLGLILEESAPDSPDYGEALRWYRLAAERGHAGAQNNLGLLYYRGLGVERSLDEAEMWFRLSAAQGFAPAQNNLGVLFLLGQSVDPALSKAIELLTLASEQGHAQASWTLDQIQDSDDLTQEDLPATTLVTSGPDSGPQ